MATQAWTFEGYWNTVLGANRNAADVVREFDLRPGDRRGVDEWLGGAEADAWAAGTQGGNVPEEWWGFHAKALDALCAVEAAG